ncbi:MAG TPA: hypothetical protein VF837_05375 [Patescibacteria group bacterium]
MRRRLVAYTILVGVLMMASAQVYIIATRPISPEVLSATTNLTVEDRVTSLERRVAALEKYTGMVKPKASGIAKENFMAITGGTTSGSDWTKIDGSDFTMDQSLYGNVKDVSWQGWMDNGYGYARIFDGTNHRAVDGSEVLVTSGVRSSFYSKTMSIWRGQNTYWIEIRSVAGPVTISTPRLRIVTQ